MLIKNAYDQNYAFTNGCSKTIFDEKDHSRQVGGCEG